MDKLKTQFGNQANIYSKYRRPYPPELYALYFSLLPQSDKIILDLACGSGNSTKPLANRDTKVFACDIDPLMIKQAQKEIEGKKLDIHYSVAEAEHLPYESDHFDGVSVGTAFHWFVNDIAIAEIKRVLKSGGLFFTFWTMTVKDIRKENEQVSDVFRSYNFPKISPELRDPEHISTFLKEYGFQNVSIVRLPIVHNATIEDRINLEKTNASYGLLLSEADKNEFLERLRRALTASLGNKPHFVIEEEIQICYGFKN